jgi:hypothetical protein
MLMIVDVSGGSDFFTFQLVAEDELYAINPPPQDSVLGTEWTTAEFNIQGDACGAEANFNNTPTIVAQTLVNTGTIGVTCSEGGSWVTAESNNLNLVGPCCPFVSGGAQGGITGPQREWPGTRFTESLAAGARPQFCVGHDLVPIMSPLLL